MVGIMHTRVWKGGRLSAASRRSGKVASQRLLAVRVWRGEGEGVARHRLQLQGAGRGERGGVHPKLQQGVGGGGAVGQVSVVWEGLVAHHTCQGPWHWHEGPLHIQVYLLSHAAHLTPPGLPCRHPAPTRPPPPSSHLELVALQGGAVELDALQRVLGVGEVEGLPLRVDAVLQWAGFGGEVGGEASEAGRGLRVSAGLAQQPAQCTSLVTPHTSLVTPQRPSGAARTLGAMRMGPSTLAEQSDHSHWMARRWGHMPVMSR